MDRFVNKKIEKQNIYEIYRACRLCGAGGGYKMPIIQNVVNLDNCDVELKQKIRECVQIEVHQDDKMPPLICELCVDKVNDFYEFLEMCRQTNKRTRLKLGLPPQMLPRGAPDAGDCILGVTEPIFVLDEDSNEPLADKRVARGGRERQRETRETREMGKKIKEEVPSPRQSRTRAPRAPSPPPSPPPRRARREDHVASTPPSKLKKSYSPPPKSILKKGKKPEPSPVTSPRLKRGREPEVKQEAPAKRVKISLKPVAKPTKLSPRLKEDESRKRAKQAEAKRREAKQRQREAEKQRELQTCAVCGGVFKTPQAMMSHRRCHVVAYTNPKLACNPCGEWFPTAEGAEAHHKRHRRGALPYRCARCGLRGTLQEYDQHIEQGECVPWEEVPDVKCESCWREFPTRPLLDAHRCGGVGARPGKCEKCGKSFSARRSLTKHTKLCKKGNVVIPPELRRRLKPLQVRVARCDPLLVNVKQERYDVSGVDTNYGLDTNCVYPYLSSGLRIKREPTNCMVKINDLDFGSYVHWDSEDDSGDSDAELDLDVFAKKRKVNSLAACALRTIFSKKFLGKVPRKFRRLKIETIIDSTLNNSLSDLNLNSDTVEDVTVSDKGGDSDKVDDSDKKVDDTEDDLFPKISSDEQVTNDDFDSLFNDNVDKNDSVDSGNKAEVSDDKTSLADMDSVESKDIKEPDDLDSGAKENIDENDSVNVSSNENITESTNDIVEKNLEEDKSLESQSDANTNAEKVTETILNSEKDITDDSQTKVDKSPSENHNQIISNDKKEDTNESEKLLENHEFEINTNAEIKPENNEIDKESVSNDEKVEKLPNCAEGLETEIEKSEPSNLESEMETEDPNKDTNSSTHENNSKENIENNTASTEEKNNEINTDKDLDANNTASKEEKNNENNTENIKDSVNIDEAKINGNTDIDDVALNMNDLEDFSGDEYDDTELMAEIDAQIGEKKKEEVEKEMEKEDSANSEKVDEVNKDRDNVDVSKKEIEISEKVKEVTGVKEEETEDAEGKDKITLEDILPKEDVKSMDLDSISDDEFDFND